jgi:voltage-gated potassium channel
MTATPMHALTPAERRRRVTLGLLRALAVATLLVTAYYLAPLDRMNAVPLGVSLAIGLLLFVAISVYEARSVLRARYPAIRAVQALATITPLFLILFAATYYLMSNDDPSNFGLQSLTRTDALYFTVTVFSTVGFGDIVATSQTARLAVTVQMILDLLILGLGIRAFVGAVQIGRQRQSADQHPATPQPPL